MFAFDEISVPQVKDSRSINSTQAANGDLGNVPVSGILSSDIKNTSNFKISDEVISGLKKIGESNRAVSDGNSNQIQNLYNIVNSYSSNVDNSQKTMEDISNSYINTISNFTDLVSNSNESTFNNLTELKKAFNLKEKVENLTESVTENINNFGDLLTTISSAPGKILNDVNTNITEDSNISINKSNNAISNISSNSFEDSQTLNKNESKLDSDNITVNTTAFSDSISDISQKETTRIERKESINNSIIAASSESNTLLRGLLEQNAKILSGLGNKSSNVSQNKENVLSQAQQVSSTPGESKTTTNNTEKNRSIITNKGGADINTALLMQLVTLLSGTLKIKATNDY